MPRSCAMTKMHFEMIARAIREAGLEPPEQEALAWHFAERLDATNPSFSASRFVEACMANVEGWVLYESASRFVEMF